GLRVRTDTSRTAVLQRAHGHVLRGAAGVAVVDGHEAVDAVPVGAHDVLRLAGGQFTGGADPYAVVVPQGVQAAVEGPAELGLDPVEDVAGLDQGAVGTGGGAAHGRLLVGGLGEQPDQGLVRELEYLLQRADGPQRLRALGPAGTLLPVTQAGDAHFDAVA